MLRTVMMLPLMGRVLLLPGWLPAWWLGRVLGLSRLAVLMMAGLFSLALVPLALYDVSAFVPLTGATGFNVCFLVLALASMGLWAWGRHGAAGEAVCPSGPAQEQDRRLHWVLGLILAYVAVVVALPCLFDGVVRQGVVRWNWIDDIQFDQGILNGILQSGLPSRNTFMKTEAPLGYPCFDMIFKAVPVFLSGGWLDPWAVSLALNVLASVSPFQ